ncbi:MAG: redoxin domain-containing protein [Bdellovibrio sp.]
MSSQFSLLFITIVMLICPYELYGQDSFQPQSEFERKLVLNNNLKKQKLGLVLIFLSMNCKTTRNHLSEMIELAKGFSKFEFVGVHSNQEVSVDEAKKFFNNLKLPFSIIDDAKLQLADRFKVVKTPHAIVLDLQGQSLYDGGISSSVYSERAQIHYLKDALEEISLGKKVTVPEGRELGCMILRK